jgi:hypothetical protein
VESGRWPACLVPRGGVLPSNSCLAENICQHQRSPPLARTGCRYLIAAPAARSRTSVLLTASSGSFWVIPKASCGLQDVRPARSPFAHCTSPREYVGRLQSLTPLTCQLTLRRGGPALAVAPSVVSMKATRRPRPVPISNRREARNWRAAGAASLRAGGPAFPAARASLMVLQSGVSGSLIKSAGMATEQEPATALSHCSSCLKATAMVLDLHPIGSSSAPSLCLSMHGTQRVRPSGASVGRRQASTSSAPPSDARIHEGAGRGMP